MRARPEGSVGHRLRGGGQWMPPRSSCVFQVAALCHKRRCMLSFYVLHHSNRRFVMWLYQPHRAERNARLACAYRSAKPEASTEPQRCAPPCLPYDFRQGSDRRVPTGTKRVCARVELCCSGLMSLPADTVCDASSTASLLAAEMEAPTDALQAYEASRVMRRWEITWPRQGRFRVASPAQSDVVAKKQRKVRKWLHSFRP